MPLNVIALAYALAASALGWGVLYVAGRRLLPQGQLPYMAAGWFGLTILLFLVPSGALFLLLAAVFIVGLRASGADPMVVWFFLIGAAPTGGLKLYDLPFGINYLFEFTFAILLSLLIAVPLLFAPKRRTRGAGAAFVDAMFLTGAVMMIVLAARGAPNLTSWMRGAFVMIVTMIVPYFAVSRRLPTMRDVEGVVGALTGSFIVMAMTAIVIAVVGWAIWDVAEARLFEARAFVYTARAGLVRAGGPLGGAPISFGTMMMVGAAFILGLRGKFEKRWQFAVALGAVLLGLIASVSRGPMVGLALAFVAYQFTQPNPAKGLARLFVLVPLAAAPFVLLTSTGREILSILPFIGEDTGGTVSYRRELLENGYIVFQRNPLFGSPTFLETPEMQSMIQGQGIIDMVNTYLHWTLLYGLVTSVPLTLAIITAGALTFRLTRKLKGDDPETVRWRRLGGGLFAAQFGFAFTIATVSLVGLLPILTWVFLGLQVAYIRTANAWLAERAAPAAVPQAAEAVVSPTDEAEPASAPVQAAKPQPRPAASFGPQTSLDELGLEGFKPIGGT